MKSETTCIHHHLSLPALHVQNLLTSSPKREDHEHFNPIPQRYHCTPVHFEWTSPPRETCPLLKCLIVKERTSEDWRALTADLKTKGAYGTSDDDFGSRRLMRIDLILQEEVTRAERLTFMCGDEQRTKGENK